MALTDYLIVSTDEGYENVTNQEGDTLTGTVDENKAVFDAYPNLIKNRFNSVVNELYNAGATTEATTSANGLMPYTDKGILGTVTPIWAFGDYEPSSTNIPYTLSGTLSPTTGATYLVIGYTDDDTATTFTTGSGTYYGYMYKYNGSDFVRTINNNYIEESVYTATGTLTCSGAIVYVYTSDSTVFPDVQLYYTYPYSNSTVISKTPLRTTIRGMYTDSDGNYYATVYAYPIDSTTFSMAADSEIIVKHNGSYAEWFAWSM